MKKSVKMWGVFGLEHPKDIYIESTKKDANDLRRNGEENMGERYIVRPVTVSWVEGATPLSKPHEL